MTTSGQSLFAATRNDIIRQAALQIGAVSAGATMSGQMLSDFAFMLNALVKHYQSTGLHIWTETEATLFLNPGQIRYAVGQGATDHCAQSETVAETEATQARAISNTFFYVEDSSAFVVGYKCGIVLDGGGIFWSTVSGVGTGNITIASPTPDSVSAGAAVFGYLSDIVLPVKVVDARRFNIATDNEVPIIMVPRLDWNSLQRRFDPGIPNQMFFDRQQATGYLNVWQVPTMTSELVKFTFWRPIQDFTSAADNPDLPQEWIMTLIYNLAVVMAPQYAVAPMKLKMITQMAAQCLGDVTGNDRETESVMFAPGFN